MYDMQFETTPNTAFYWNENVKGFASTALECPFCRHEPLTPKLRQPPKASSNFYVFLNALEYLVGMHPEVPGLLELKMIANILPFPQAAVKFKEEAWELGITNLPSTQRLDIPARWLYKAQLPTGRGNPNSRGVSWDPWYLHE